MERKIIAYQNDIVIIKIELVVNYSLTNSVSQPLAASKEFDEIGLSSLDKPIINLPTGQRINTHYEAHSNFIETVNKVDELLERRGIEVVGETEHESIDSESTYREILLNASKDTDSMHYSIAVANFLRLAARKETISSQRNRQTKLENAVDSEESKDANNDQSPEIVEFQSIIIQASVSDPSKVNISNKEFYTYKDAIQCVDEILDTWTS